MRLWPRTLVVRLFLIFLVGLVLAHGLSFALLFYERYDAAKSMMLGDLERDVVVAAAVLDRLPENERQDWLPRLSHDNRQYLLGEGDADQPLQTAATQAAAQAIETALNGAYPLSIRSMKDDPRHIQARIELSDGRPVILDIHMSLKLLALWLPVVFVLQLVLLVGCAWFAVRLAIRPLTRLANAADSLNPNDKITKMSEEGPAEVAHAAVAFNAMRERIASHLAERMQILAAISHDLQTPITRMKLRSEFMDDSTDKEKLTQDLNEVERLVREGVAYARSATGITEKPGRVDLHAFLDSLVCDYQDMGKPVNLSGDSSVFMLTRPHALRRILGNLIDNALKFAGAVEVRVQPGQADAVSIFVCDTGPGIPEDELEAVLQPFYRLESSRNRDSGGTGLGLAIAQQLALVIGGRLLLCNRDGGGLSVELRLSGSL